MAKTNAPGANCYLSADVSEAIAISNEGGIPAMVEIAKSGNNSAKGRVEMTLRSYVVGHDRAMYRRIVVDVTCGVVLAIAGDETTQENAAIALFMLT